MVQHRLGGSIRWSKVEPEFVSVKHALHLRDPGVQSDQPCRYGDEHRQAAAKPATDGYRACASYRG